MICRDIVNYKILVVITPIKIKQTKKHGVVSVMSFNTFKRALTDVMWCVSMFYSVNTKITNFSISGTSTSKIIYFFTFFGLYLQVLLDG